MQLKSVKNCHHTVIICVLTFILKDTSHCVDFDELCLLCFMFLLVLPCVHPSTSIAVSLNGPFFCARSVGRLLV